MNKFIANIEDAIIDQNEIWFFVSNFNGLFSKTVKGKLCFHGSVPWEPISGKRLYASIQKVDKKIYLIPCYAKSIAVYDIEKKDFYQIILNVSDGSSSFMASAIYQNSLFMFGFYSPCIVKLDLYSEKIKYIDRWYNEAQSYIWDISAPFFRRQLLHKEETFYIPFFNANLLLELDIKSLYTKIHILGRDNRAYSGICEWNSKIICLSYMQNNPIVVFDCNSDESKKEKCNDLLFLNDKCHFSGIANIGTDLHIFTLFLDEKEIKNLEKMRIYKGDYSFVREENGLFYYYDRLSGDFIIFDKAKHEVINDKIEMDLIYLNIFSLEDNIKMYENAKDDIKKIFEYIQYKNKDISIKDTEDTGKVIYKQV